jgi:hypothetical protein
MPDDETDALPVEAAVAELALSDLVRAATSHASRLERLANEYQIPMSTLRALTAAGRGPPTFLIGRLLFVRRGDWVAWLDMLAGSGGARISGGAPRDHAERPAPRTGGYRRERRS